MDKLLKIKTTILSLCILLFLLLNISPMLAESDESKLLIYNAASTTDIILEITKEWESLNLIKIRSSSASSSSLAKQLANGAPANIYISASWLWIEELKKLGIIKAETIKPIFENRLVLIAPKNSSINNIGLINNKIKLEEIFNNNLTNSRISIADPSHVPAGVYTKQALLKLGLWKDLNRKNMAWGGDVRRTLKFVALENSPLGIVYYTDAIAEKNVKIIGKFSKNLHSPIQYWVAAIKNNTTENTMRFISFLESNYSKNIYSKHGFKTIESK
jgi:molybdate transport system substrate-binding protein